ncbi:hypothetical protein [Burkholderia cepacia]|uniref:hypothetical protein n=1 Tax=Burkholderia cepacia TaxID=292 RepID=UPI0016517C9D|nr:hypothetical protein [Burkholderia cepacia]
MTRGEEASGIATILVPGGTIDVADTLIRTSGLFGTGLSLSYGGIRATLKRTDIRTDGDYASVLYMPGASTVIFSDSHLETSGYAALGVDTREGSVEFERTRIVTHGISSHGLYASKEYTDTPVIDATDTHVTTTGKGAIGLVARLGGKVAMLDRNASSFSVPRDRAALRVGATGQVSKRFAISAGLGVEANLSDYAMVKGELAAKYRW